MFPAAENMHAFLQDATLLHTSKPIAHASDKSAMVVGGCEIGPAAWAGSDGTVSTKTGLGF
jgi:hypothetical protein